MLCNMLYNMPTYTICYLWILTIYEEKFYMQFFREHSSTTTVKRNIDSYNVIIFLLLKSVGYNVRMPNKAHEESPMWTFVSRATDEIRHNRVAILVAKAYYT